jgi:branched-chain amino acid transport system substrate-binding protein
LADAIKRSGSLDRKSIRDAIANTSNFHGISGNISFNNNGDPIKQIIVLKITDGKAFFHKIFSP